MPNTPDFPALARACGWSEYKIAAATLDDIWPRSNSTCGMWAFMHIRPVLRAAGWVIIDSGEFTSCETPLQVAYQFSGDYFAATSAAILWMQENQPNALAGAVRKVKEG